MFSSHERDYLQTQRLARFGTVEPDGQLDVDAVGFKFDGAFLYWRGQSAKHAQIQKYRSRPSQGFPHY